MNALTHLRDLLAEQDYQQAFAQQVARDLNLPRAQIKLVLWESRGLPIYCVLRIV